MGIVSDLIAAVSGRTGEAPQDIEQKLKALGFERGDAREKIAKLLARRQELLLVDGTDREIAKLDAELDSLRLAIERLDAIEPKLHERLVELRETERRERWKTIADRHHDALETHVRALRVAAASAEALAATRGEAIGGGFVREANGLLEPLAFINSETLANYLEHYNRHCAVRSARNV